MRRKETARFLLFVLPLAALVTGGCGKKGGPRAAARPETVAMTGERPVTLGEFMAWAKKATSEDPKNVSPRVLSSLLDQYLEEVLLARAVEAAEPPVPGANAAEKRRAFLARAAGLETLQDADLRKEYDAHPERYKRPALVRASQLLFHDKASADAAVKRLDLGAAWLDVSKESSVAPNAGSGGSLGRTAFTCSAWTRGWTRATSRSTRRCRRFGWPWRRTEARRPWTRRLPAHASASP